MSPEILVAIIGILCFFAIEGYYLATGKDTISGRVRKAYLNYPAWGFLSGLIIGLLCGHFFWFI